jgi:hypothetical protein
MDVSQTNPQFDNCIYDWRMVRDFVAGSSQVKRQNTLYLPIPAAMTAATVAPDLSTEQLVDREPRQIGGFAPSSRSENQRINENTPWYYPQNLAYQSYLRRARVPDMTSFALRAMLGIATRKNPTVEIPDSLSYLVDNATDDGFTLNQLFAFLVSQVLQCGRVGLLLDVTPDSQFKFKVYAAEAGINWCEEMSATGEKVLEYVVLQEDARDEQDKYSHEVKPRYVVLHKNEEGTYETAIHSNPSGAPDEINVPSYRGNTLRNIPFMFVGSVDNTPDCDPAPLDGVAEVCQHVYMKEADLANAEFMTCNPTLVMTGAEPSEAPQATGSNVAVILSDPQSKVFYTETDTSGLSHVMSHIKELQEEAAAFGATVLGARKNAAETAESKRIDQSVGGATLHSAVMCVGEAIESMLNKALEWQGSSPDAIFEPSTEFSNVSLSAQEVQAYLSAYMQGAFSLDSLVELWRRAGLLPEGDTVEDEVDRIERSMAGSNDEFIGDDEQ